MQNTQVDSARTGLSCGTLRDSASSSADAVSHKHRQGKHKGKHNKDKKPQLGICNKCGYDAKRSHYSGKCPAEDSHCWIYNKIGHFRKCCPKKSMSSAVVAN